jgi:hypothetical protein
VLRLRVGGLGEVQRWVMQFGAEAEVLSPAVLRRAVAAQLESALSAYRARELLGARSGRRASVTKSERVQDPR